MDAAAGLGGGPALDTMHAALELQPAPGTLALDEEDDLLETAHAGGVAVHHLHLPLLALRVLRVHAGEIGGEERSLVAPRAGANLDEDVAVVVGIPGGKGGGEVVLRPAFLPPPALH